MVRPGGRSLSGKDYRRHREYPQPPPPSTATTSSTITIVVRSMCSTSLPEDLAPASPCVARRTCRSRPAPPRPPVGNRAGSGPYPQDMCNTRSMALPSRLGRSLPCGVKQLGGRRRHLRNGGTGDTHPRDRRGSEFSEPRTRSRTCEGPGRRRVRARRSWPGRGGRIRRHAAPRALRAKHSSEPAGRTRVGSEAKRAGARTSRYFTVRPQLLVPFAGQWAA